MNVCHVESLQNTQERGVNRSWSWFLCSSNSIGVASTFHQWKTRFDYHLAVLCITWADEDCQE